MSLESSLNTLLHAAKISKCSKVDIGYLLRVGASLEKMSPARKCSVPGAEFAYSLPEKHNINKLGQFSYQIYSKPSNIWSNKMLISFPKLN